MKFNIGDKVTVSRYLKHGDERDGGCYITKEMELLGGRKGIVKDVVDEFGGRYRLDIGSDYWFSVSMLIGEGEEDVEVESENAEIYSKLKGLLEKLAFVRRHAAIGGASLEKIDEFIATEGTRLFEMFEKMSLAEMTMFALFKTLEEIGDRDE